MHKWIPRVAVLLLTGSVLSLLTVQAAPVPRAKKEVVIQDRKSFIPWRKYFPVEGKAMGILVNNVREKMAHEGRSGPGDAMGFSLDGGSYRWMYVPVNDARPRISNLRVKVGPGGDRLKVYPRLDMIRPLTIQQWNLQGEHALVEVEVNDGMGAPPQEGFVATAMKKLDGTKEYPLNVAKLVQEYEAKYQKFLTTEKGALDKDLQKAQADAIQGGKPTGPRETKTLTYLTWLAKEQALCIRFHTKITDGAYKYSQGGARPDPFPLPVPPVRNGNGKRVVPPAIPRATPRPAQPPTERPVAVPPRAVPPRPVPPRAVPPQAVPPGRPRGGAFPPPPRELPRVRYGTSFGIDFGRGYVISKSGNLLRTEVLSTETFKKVIPPPPQVGRPVRPVDPVPVRPLPQPVPRPLPAIKRK